MSETWAIIPVKSFERAKSRLAAALPVAERRALATALFDHALGACLACTAIDRILIASDGAEALLRARSRGALTLPDPSPRVPFARVVDAALAHARSRGATRAVVVMADLPLLQSRDLLELLAALSPARRLRSGHSQLVLAPDHHRRGLGALACNLPAPLPMQLGQRDSFARTLRAARARELDVTLVRNPRLARDIDTAADLSA